MSPAPETRLGPYTITRELGRGGMGVVYLARDTRLERDVAIKALPEHLAANPDRVACFVREAKTPIEYSGDGPRGHQTVLPPLRQWNRDSKRPHD